MRYLFLIALLVSGTANAVQATLEWQLQAIDCAGDTVSLSDYTTMEIYISSQDIPASGGPCSDIQDQPPTGVIPQIVMPLDNEVTVDLPGGFTYFARMRVQHIDGRWSNFSDQSTLVIPSGHVSPPILLRFDL